MAEEPTMLTDPAFEAFTVILHEGVDRAVAAPELADFLAAATGGDTWRPEGLSPVDPSTFELVGPTALTSGEAWDLAYALAAQPGVAHAEPVFEVDAGVDQPGVSPPPPGVEGFGPVADHADFFWPHDLLDVDDAWALPLPPGGRSHGEGIVIGHPDSGFLVHTELDPAALDLARSRDFVDHNASAQHSDGHHGLGTGSVIVSRDNRQQVPRSVTGIAPKATLIPYRVAKKRALLPVPILFRSGMDRLRRALLEAVANGVDVISISLGWLPNEGVKRALRIAVERGIIVCCAAGNQTWRLIVWPAAYSDAIALAACDPRRQPWSGSARGPRVDATAPGHLVWRAVTDPASIEPSSGTSYSAAITAGLAALWLAFHGREAVHARASELGIRVCELFRRFLRSTCDPPPDGSGFWGSGIVNARALLARPLAAGGLESFGAETAELAGVPLLFATFDALPREEVRRRAAAILGVAPEGLEEAIRGREQEVVSAFAAEPRIREQLSSPAPAVAAGIEVFGAAQGAALSLSTTLRTQLAVAG